MSIGHAATDLIHDAVARRYGDPVAPENEAAAYEYQRALTNHASLLDDAIADVGRHISAGDYTRIIVTLLTGLHPIHLNDLAHAVGRAIAAKDPARTDGRFSEHVQTLADWHRSASR
jgi:predicted AlkP superfamily phosphohydrolase/phosphomutase